MHYIMYCIISNMYRNVIIDYNFFYRRDGVVVGASALKSVNLRFISNIESYHKILKNGIHSFPAWRSHKNG